MLEKRSLRSNFIRFLLEENKGTVAVEAGFVLPGLMLFLLGFMTILSMQNASTSVGKVTYTVADMLTQVRALTAQDVDCAFLAGESLMTNYNTANLEMVMIGIDIDEADNTATVAWSRGRNLKFRSLPIVGANITNEVPSELMKDTSGFVVMAEGQLKHTGYISKVLNEENGFEPLVFNYKNFFIPRVSNNGIGCPDCNTAAPRNPC